MSYSGNEHQGEILENGLLVAKSYSVEKFERLSTWAVVLSVPDPEECSDLVTRWSRPARPSLWHVFLGEMKCTHTITQIHKLKYKYWNTNIKMQIHTSECPSGHRCRQSARPSLWYVFLGKIRCIITNTQIQMHKLKYTNYKNENTQIKMPIWSLAVCSQQGQAS